MTYRGWCNPGIVDTLLSSIVPTLPLTLISVSRVKAQFMVLRSVVSTCIWIEHRPAIRVFQNGISWLDSSDRVNRFIDTVLCPLCSQILYVVVQCFFLVLKASFLYMYMISRFGIKRTKSCFFLLLFFLMLVFCLSIISPNDLIQIKSDHHRMSKCLRSLVTPYITMSWTVRIVCLWIKFTSWWFLTLPYSVFWGFIFLFLHNNFSLNFLNFY